jgi:ketosteroid isomerase-like protein
MMSLETNKAVVRSYFEAVNAGDCDATLTLTTEDFLFATMARAPDWLQIEWGRDAFSQVPPTMSQLMKAPIHLSVLDMIGEGDKITVEAETDGKMLNGRRYNNAYHFALELADGKLRREREYSCSYLAQSCFGAVEPGNPEASKMAD